MVEQDNKSVDKGNADADQAAEEQQGADAQQTAEAAESSAEGEDLQVLLERARAEAEEARDQAVRAAAEAQNTRRRAEKDIEHAHKFALERFAGDLLEVADNLERALAAADSSDDAFKPVIEGLELTYRSLMDTLGRYNIEQIDPQGEPFDPQLHQAMSMIASPDSEPNSVLQVMQKGYTLNGRLLRAAMVIVAKPD